MLASVSDASSTTIIDQGALRQTDDDMLLLSLNAVTTTTTTTTCSSCVTKTRSHNYCYRCQQEQEYNLEREPAQSIASTLGSPITSSEVSSEHWQETVFPRRQH
ncbi:hypothetical protein TKK_0008645 [Trichogramma kaykai]